MDTSDWHAAVWRWAACCSAADRARQRQVTASRPIACQHAYGPTFALSEGELAGLAKSLEASSSEPELKGLCQ